MFHNPHVSTQDPLFESLNQLTTLVAKNEVKQIKALFNKTRKQYPIGHWVEFTNLKPLVDKAFSLAVANGNLACITLFLNVGVSPFTSYWDEKKCDTCILTHAIEQGNAQVVKELTTNLDSLGRTDQKVLNDSLVQAVEIGDLELVKILLKAGASANYTTDHTESLHREQPVLEVAAARGDERIAELLVQQGASIHKALAYAQDVYRKTLERLKQQNVFHGNVIEYETINQEYHRLIKTLLDLALGIDYQSKEIDGSYKLAFIRGMNVSGMNFVGLSIDGVPVTKDELANHLVSGLNEAFFTEKDWERLNSRIIGEGPISRYLSLKKRLKIIKQRRGDLVDEAGVVNVSPLYAAVRSGNLKALQARLDAGEDPNKTSSFGDNPIIDAARIGDQQIIKALLAAKITIQTNHLIIALDQAKNVAVMNLLRPFIPLDQLDDKENTLLHLAASKNDTQEIKRLLALGADMSAMNCNGQKPLHVAIYYANLEAVKLLVNEEIIRNELSDLDEQSCFCKCIQYFNKEVVILKYLLSLCDESLMTDHVKRLFKIAIENGNLKAAKLLIPRLVKIENWSQGLVHEIVFANVINVDMLELMKDIGAELSESDFERQSVVCRFITRATNFLAAKGSSLRSGEVENPPSLSDVYERGLRILLEMNACFADAEEKEKSVKQLRSILEHYPEKGGESFFSLVDGISVKATGYSLVVS